MEKNIVSIRKVDEDDWKIIITTCKNLGITTSQAISILARIFEEHSDDFKEFAKRKEELVDDIVKIVKKA